MGIGGYDLVAVGGDPRGLALCRRAGRGVSREKDEEGKEVYGYEDFPGRAPVSAACISFGICGTRILHRLIY